MGGEPRIHGKTLLQKDLCYEIFHRNYGSNLNITNNYYGCGGSIWGGWGCWGGGNLGAGLAWGAGAGVAAGIMNLLGLGGNGGGCFGGGSWWNPSSWWGGGGGSSSTTRTTTTGGSSTTVTGGNTYIEKTPKNKDEKPIKKMCKRYKNLLDKHDKIEKKGKDPLTDSSFLKDIKNLYNEVVSYKELDGVNDDDVDKPALDNLKNDLEALYPSLNKYDKGAPQEQGKQGNTLSKTNTSGNDNTPTVTGTTDELLPTEVVPAVTEGENELKGVNKKTEKVETSATGDNNAKVQSAEPDFNTITLEQITTAEQIENANPAISEQQAIRILKDGGRTNGDGGNMTVKIPRNYKELLLAHISGLKIQFCKNKALDDNKRQSSTIQGIIKGGITNNDDDGTYSVKVKDTYGTYNLKFAFGQDGKTGKVILESGTGAKVKYKENEQEKEVELKSTRADVSYEIKADSEWATRDNSNAAMYNKRS